MAETGVTAIHAVSGTTVHAALLRPPVTVRVPPPSSTGEVAGILLLCSPDDVATLLLPKSISKVPSLTMV